MIMASLSELPTLMKSIRPAVSNIIEAARRIECAEGSA